MSRNHKTRLDRVEGQMVVSDDQIQFARAKRFSYNLRSVSDAALTAKVRSLIGEIELPDWAEAEFNRPIPADADARRVREAEAAAAPVLDVSDDKIQSGINLFHEHASTLGFDNLREYQWCFHIAESEGVPFYEIKEKMDSGKRQIPANYS